MQSVTTAEILVGTKPMPKTLLTLRVRRVKKGPCISEDNRQSRPSTPSPHPRGPSYYSSLLPNALFLGKEHIQIHNIIDNVLYKH